MPIKLSLCDKQVIFGPMFSGKTTELIRRLKRYQIANYKCLIVKYAADNRYTRDGIATHDREELPAVARTSLMGLDAKDFDVVGIDEAQFFSDVVEFSERMANDGKIVIVAALDATYQRQSFGDILKLVPLAENVVKLTAVCVNCYKDASFTKRRTNEKEVELIGGTDKYEAVCRKCYFLLSPDKGKLQQHFSPSKVKKSAQAQTFEDTVDSFETRKAKKLLIDSF